MLHTAAHQEHLTPFDRCGSKAREIAPLDGAAVSTPMVGRGAAYADGDNDGDLDVLVTANGDVARLFRNDGGNRNQMLRIQTVGSASNRNGIGARVEVSTADGVQCST